MPERKAANDATTIASPDAIDSDILPELIGYQLRRAQLSVFHDFAETMSTEQITPGQFGVLALVGANPGLTQSALARAVGIERSTMVAVIDTLEGRGVVERRPSPVDRRSYALMLSVAGTALLARLKALVQSHEQRIGAHLSDQERATLILLLERIAENGA